MLLIFLAACKEKKAPQLFYGECSVQVESKTKDAEIIVDGILVGHDEAKLNIPCGEKQVRVVKHGYVPYTGYHPVTTDAPIKVTVELERLKHSADFALSRRLIDQIRNGKKIRDPGEHGGPDEDAPEEKMVVAAASAPSAGGAAAGVASGGEFSTNVEDWR